MNKPNKVLVQILVPDPAIAYTTMTIGLEMSVDDLLTNVKPEVIEKLKTPLDRWDMAFYVAYTKIVERALNMGVMNTEDGKRRKSRIRSSIERFIEVGVNGIESNTSCIDDENPDTGLQRDESA